MTPNVSITLLRTQTDERLVALVAAGHERAFDAIVERYSKPLLRHARRMLREDGRAEDVVQAAFVSAWTALSEGTAVRDLRPWLYRIVHNGALNAMKKPGGADAPLTEMRAASPGPETEVLQREEVRRALDTISGLPERQRAALLAVALEGRSHADVGEDLGIDDTAVRQLVSRARRSMRVAATAVTPWPLAAWLAGTGGAHASDTAARVGEIVGGVGAGTVFGSGAMKAGAIVAATGAVAVGAPQVAQVVREQPRPARAVPAAGTPGGDGPAHERSGGSGAPQSPGPGSAATPAGDDTRAEARQEGRTQSDDSGTSEESGESESRGDGGSGSEGRHGDSGGSHEADDHDAERSHDRRGEGRKRAGGDAKEQSRGRGERENERVNDPDRRSGAGGEQERSGTSDETRGKQHDDGGEPSGADKGSGGASEPRTEPEQGSDAGQTVPGDTAEDSSHETSADSSVTFSP